VGGGAGVSAAGTGPGVEPAREALLADARAEAARLLAAADDDARTLLDRARSAAERTVAEARAEGQAAGRAKAAGEEGRAGVRAHWEVLAAQRAACERLRTLVLERAPGLRDEPGYPVLLERLTAATRAALGEGAVLEVDPAGAGGVRGSAPGRAADCTLPALAERCLRDRGPALARLWA
jgi:vacuolar-type H+-ATPase subunit E/Vma4